MAAPSSVLRPLSSQLKAFSTAGGPKNDPGTALRPPGLVFPDLAAPNPGALAPNLYRLGINLWRRWTGGIKDIFRQMNRIRFAQVSDPPYYSNITTGPGGFFTFL